MTLAAALHWRSKAAPHEPVDYADAKGDTAPVVYAVRAMFAGTASESQQKLFMAWLAYSCGAGDTSYRPGGHDGERATCFAEGRKFPWAQITKMTHPALTPKTAEPRAMTGTERIRAQRATTSAKVKTKRNRRR